MRWERSEEQADFRSVLRDWLRERCSPSTVRGWLDARDPGVFAQQFAAEGWSAVGSPEELGGQDGGLVELALAAEELGRAVAPSSAWLGSVLAVPGVADAADGALVLVDVESAGVEVRPQMLIDRTRTSGSRRRWSSFLRCDFGQSFVMVDPPARWCGSGGA